MCPNDVLCSASSPSFCPHDLDMISPLVLDCSAWQRSGHPHIPCKQTQRCSLLHRQATLALRTASSCLQCFLREQQRLFSLQHRRFWHATSRKCQRYALVAHASREGLRGLGVFTTATQCSALVLVRALGIMTPFLLALQLQPLWRYITGEYVHRRGQSERCW